jgi:alpha-tubulin suppressor-like RCC1 family protein
MTIVLGTVACWGDDRNAQLTPPAGRFTQVSAGYQHACGLRTDSTVACWGATYYRAARPPAGALTQVSAGGDFTCALKRDARIACWGGAAVGRAPTSP